MLFNKMLPPDVCEDVSCEHFPVQQSDRTIDVLAAARADVICCLEEKFEGLIKAPYFTIFSIALFLI